jgi:hypothetical protein
LDVEDSRGLHTRAVREHSFADQLTAPDSLSA